MGTSGNAVWGLNERAEPLKAATTKENLGSCSHPTSALATCCAAAPSSAAQHRASGRKILPLPVLQNPLSRAPGLAAPPRSGLQSPGQRSQAATRQPRRCCGEQRGAARKAAGHEGTPVSLKKSREAQAGDPSMISFFINLPRPSILPHRHHCCGCRSSWCPSGSATQVPGTIPVTLERRSPPHGAQEPRRRSICPNCSPSR